MSGAITDNASREARDRRLQEDFRSRLDSSCAVMVDHFYGLCKAAHLDCTEEEGSKISSSGSSSAATQQFSEQEELRRSGFHVALHAERLASAGAVE